jgi:LysR family transcriptional regulator, glycine cleavage system transcriptional activator
MGMAWPRDKREFLWYTQAQLMSDPLANIPLSALRIFESAARLKSFTRAAQELHVTQAAVSWQVKALEQRLDQPLFRRLPREVELTPGGERLARAASEAMTLLRTALSDLTETGEGVLSVTTLESLAVQWLAPRIGGFQLAHPKIAVRLETGGQLADLLHSGFDVGLRSGSGDWPGLESHFLFHAGVTPLCTPEVRHELGGLSRPDDLLSAPLIGLEEEWAQWFAAADLSAPARSDRGRLIADLQSIEVGSALAGRGVALGSPILFAPELAQGRLVQPYPILWSRSAGYWLAFLKDRRRAPKIAAFRDWLLASVAEDANQAARQNLSSPPRSTVD